MKEFFLVFKGFCVLYKRGCLLELINYFFFFDFILIGELEGLVRVVRFGIK